MTKSSYVDFIRRLDELLGRFPKMRWLLAGCLPVQYFGRTGRWEFPDEVRRTFARDNLRLEINFPIVWGAEWDFPYPEAQTLVRDLFKKYGAEKLIWGSDMPNVERYCTYRQCLDYVRKYCTFMSSAEMDLVLGANLRELCKIQTA